LKKSDGNYGNEKKLNVKFWKISVENLSSRLDKTEDRLSGLEEKVDVLENADENKKKH
jgi:hypothetical protein